MYNVYYGIKINTNGLTLLQSGHPDDLKCVMYIIFRLSHGQKIF